MGIILMAFFPLDRISDRAEEIYKRAKEEVTKLDPNTVSASYIDQMQLLLARLNPETSNSTCELIMIPGFASGPSELTLPAN